MEVDWVTQNSNLQPLHETVLCLYVYLTPCLMLQHYWVNKDYVMLCYVMLCYVMLCYVMAQTIINSSKKIGRRVDRPGDTLFNHYKFEKWVPV